MADFVLSSGSICRPHRSPFGNFPVKTGLLSTGVSSAAIVIGRRLTLDWTGSTTAGLVIASTHAIGGAPFMLVGIAAMGASGSTAATRNEIQYWEANPMVEFKAATKGATLQSSNIGQRKKLTRDSTLDIEYVDLTASTAADWRVIITGLVDAEGDSGGYVSFRFLSRLQDNIGSSIAQTSTTPLLAFFS